MYYLRQGTRPADKELGRLPIKGMSPIPETREATSDSVKEGAAVDGVEGVGTVQRHINPTWVTIEDHLDRVDSKVQA